MRVELPILSFVCVTILAIILSLNLRRISVTNLSIVGWLLTCNFLHAINSIVWADNVTIQISSWCDIVTKILLGSNVALPAACLCRFRNLEQSSSTRTISDDPLSRRKKKVLEVTLCLFLPILYVLLHFFVQHHRFEIVQDFGCQAAIYPSILAIILIWLPPLLLCSIAFMYFGLALFNMFRQRTNLSQHLLTREPPLTVPSFVCQLLSTAIQTSLIAFVIIYSIFAQTSLGLRPWTSWSAVHSRFSEIKITSDMTLSEVGDAMVDFMWWTIPVYSLIFIVFFAFDKFSQGHCSSWVRKIMLQKIDPALPMHTKAPPIVLTSDATPVHHLPSFWDDTFDAKLHRQSQRSPPKRKTSLKPQHDEYSPPCSPEANASFKESTLTYVESPIGRRALKLPGVSSKNTSSDSNNFPDLATNADKRSSILNPSPATNPAASSSSLSAYSTDSHVPSSTSRISFGEAQYAASPAYLRDPPFEGSNIPANPSPNPSKSIMKQTRSSGSIRRTISSREGNYGLRPEDVIYMTVVHETSP